ncbi:uncharacterized protein LOC144586546 isoform X2 [Pogona vitticeps]
MSVPGKMVESLIQDKILKHIEEQALLREKQHGFCKGAEIFYKFNNEGRRLYEKRGEEVKKLRRKEKKKIDEKQEEEQSSGSLGPNSEGSSEFQLQNQMGSAKGKPIVEKRGSKKREENLNNKDA